MKTIKKLKNNMKTVAGSALLVGATLTAGAAAVTAQDSGSSGDLGDYPAPFVTDDGEVDATVVVGETAQDGEPVSTLDVVSAIEVAGSLGNAAFAEEETTVSVEGSTSATWNAENGAVLNRQNSDIYLGDATDAEKNRLDDGDVSALATTSFQSEDNEQVDVEHEVNVGTQHQNFNAAGDNDDPLLHVEVPTNPDSNDNLFQAEAEFSDTMDFSVQSMDSIDANADEVVEDGDQIELFGQEYTYSDETGEEELVLYGSSDTFEVQSGESSTVTIDGEDHEFQVDYVSDTDPRDATIVVDGSTESVQESDKIEVGDAEVRVSDIYRTGADGQGRVAFSQGSDELAIQGDGDVEIDGDTVDGVSVSIDSNSDDSGTFGAVDGMTFHFGAEDSDEDFVEAGGTYEDPVFGALEFQYGGLSANTAEEPAEALEVEVNEDDSASLTFTSQGEEADVTFADETGTLGDDDGSIAEYEGQDLVEDDRVVLNANEEAAMYEISDVTTDLTDSDLSSDEGEISVTLENVHTGDSVTVEDDGLSDTDDQFSGDSDNAYTLESESIEGMDFDVTVDNNDDVNFVRSTTSANERQVYPGLYTESEGVVAFDSSGDIDLTNVLGDVTNSDFTGGADQTLNDNSDNVGPIATLDSSTPAFNINEVRVYEADGDEKTATGLSTQTVTIDDSDGDSPDVVVDDGAEITRIEVEAAQGSGTVSVSTGADAAGTDTANDIEIADVTKTLEVPSGVASNDADRTFTFTSPAAYGSASSDTGFPSFVQASYSLSSDNFDLNMGDDAQAQALFVQPEDDNEEEHAYAWDVGVGSSTATLDTTYSGTTSSTGAEGDLASDVWAVDDLDSEDNVQVGYNVYGTYTRYNDDETDQEVFTANVPAAQSNSGMAVTGTDGSLSSEGGGGSGSAPTSSPTYEFAGAALDNEMEGSARTDSNLILVGGPSVNSLVQELVDENQTMAAEDYTEGEGMIQMVDGFSEDHSALIVAGHSGEDTRAAGEFLANYRDHQADLEGQSEVTVSTETGQVVE